MERERERERESEREREREGRRPGHSEPVVEFEEWKSDWSFDLKVEPPH